MKENACNAIPTHLAYCTVVNDEGHYAIWPCAHPLPLGWRETGMYGDRVACLAHVGRTWTDMRPHALQRGDKSRALSGRGANETSETCIHHLFETQAAQHPEAPALIFCGEEMTYGELNRRANRLARHLKTLGAGPETHIGIHMERSPELVIGILGILKAGGAYLPLDPAYPRSRLACMCDDVDILLTQRRLARRAPEQIKHVICLDSEQPGGCDHNLSESPQADHAAYVIYTSGSTGAPKGVVVSHRNLVHATTLRSVHYAEPVTALLLLPSIAFDASSGALFWALTEGGALVLPAQGEERDVFRLTELIAQHRVSHWLSVPTLYSALLAQHRSEDLASLRAVIVGGERCPARLVARHYRNLPEAYLYNDYGPTEGTILSSMYLCRAQDGVAEAPVPIGKAVSGVDIHLLDAEMNPVSQGADGEVYIGGAGIARGYLNRPDLTAERFVPDPFGPPGTRLYKTGDLARRLTDGNLVFIDRLDDQVKVRGYRIEPGEIETVLGRHPVLRDAVVIARENETGKNRLLAYVVAESRPLPSKIDLRAYLSRSLPDYMVPADFVFLDTLPLLPNGKVDRAALPEPDRPSLPRPFAAPQEKTEFELARIWASVLNTGPVDLHEDFFELGGDSIAAAHLLLQIEAAFNQRLSLPVLMQAPTVEKLARVLDARTGETSWSSLVPIRPCGARAPLFLIHGITGQVLHYYNLANYLDKDWPIYGLQAPKTPYDRIEPMAIHYLEALRAVQPEGPYHLAGYCFGGLVAFEMAQRLRAIGQEVNFLGLWECPAPTWGFSKMKWGARGLANLFCSLPCWVLEFLEHPCKHSIRLQNLVGRALRRVAHVPLPLEAPPVSEGPVVDLSGYWKAHHEYVKVHARALNAYVPKPYSGTLTLFKARTLTRFHLDPELGWGELADVEVHPISGSHDNTLYEPHVQVLAQKLAASLNRIASS